MTHPSQDIGENDLERQRRRRLERRLLAPAPDGPESSLGDAIGWATAALDESGGGVDVGAVLEARGYGWRTIEMVKAHLATLEERT